MSMEINGSSGRPPIETPDGQAADKVGNPNNNGYGTANTARGSADTLSLTNKATQLQELEARIAELPVVDTQRVQDVQHALATGTHQIEPARVADKLLSFETGLNTAPPPT